MVNLKFKLNLRELVKKLNQQHKQSN